jgi:hypothetical protein
MQMSVLSNEDIERFARAWGVPLVGCFMRDTLRKREKHSVHKIIIN